MLSKPTTITETWYGASHQRNDSRYQRAIEYGDAVYDHKRGQRLNTWVLYEWNKCVFHFDQVAVKLSDVKVNSDHWFDNLAKKKTELGDSNVLGMKTLILNLQTIRISLKRWISMILIPRFWKKKRENSQNLVNWVIFKHFISFLASKSIPKSS